MSNKAKAGGKREEVLSIASDCFLELGFDGTSINVMARDAGISKESIYRYFGSKEDLFESVVDRELEVYRQGMQKVDMDYKQLSLADALSHVAVSTLKLLANDRTLALRRLIFQMAAKQSKVGKHYYEIGPSMAYGNLKKIMDHHSHRTDYDAESLSHYFIGMVLHDAMLQRECGMIRPMRAKALETHCRSIVEDFVSAFFKQEG